MKKLTKKLISEISRAIFADYYIIYYTKLISETLFEIEINNDFTLMIEAEFSNDIITLYLHSNSDNYHKLGTYSIEYKQFTKTDDFWEVLFFELIRG